MWATVLLVPAFFLQGDASPPEFSVTSGWVRAGAVTPVADRAGALTGLAAPAVRSEVPPATVVAPTTSPPTTAAAAVTSTSSTTRALATTIAPTSTSTTTTTRPAATTTSTRVTISLPLVSLKPAANSDRGVASWFGAPDGTCAHRTLPFGTVVKVTRIHNGAVATCIVDDRGPSDMSRVIDLSDDTFLKLADLEAGLVDVIIEW